MNDLNNTPDYTANFDPADIAANKTVSILAYFGILFFIPLVAAPTSRYGRFNANQGLLLLLLGAAGGIVSAIPVIGWIVGPLVSIAVLVLLIIGIMNVSNGKAKTLPVIGKIFIIK